MKANYGYKLMNRLSIFDKNSKRNIDNKCTTNLSSDLEEDYNSK